MDIVQEPMTETLQRMKKYSSNSTSQVDRGECVHAKSAMHAQIFRNRRSQREPGCNQGNALGRRATVNNRNSTSPQLVLLIVA
jgi:hypothetical protein